ncbi:MULTISPECIES: DUF2935 domain-containing protein [Bacillaceae]|uniref:DUF2935 domain-containing protein n=1 Tax=Bacillaceae TaxID=186817 RepID=UPI0006F1DF13|nr:MULTISPECIES: DUF2935 domain-containing protein [Bacillaceae]KQL37588.1 hypothetical protein AN959_03365 [Psychrobacillus sp. FJAT-21963]MDF2068736.1 DUF2935 domain-containing protein [Bacillus sp. Cr_A10]
MGKTFEESALYELHFWLKVLEDHGRFIHDSLAPSEKEKIEVASSFIKRFSQLLTTSKQSLSKQELISLAAKAKTSSEKIRSFKLYLLKEHLVGNIKIALPPTFINHMVNEVEEAIRVFSYLEKGENVPIVHLLHHDLLWLLDAAGHAGAIDANLDSVEKKLKEKGQQFMKEWEDFYLKAVEFAGYLRTNIEKFPALDKFHDDVELEMKIFKMFLKELEEMRIKKEALGTFTPLMADHMAREETYYLTKLAQTT